MWRPHRTAEPVILSEIAQAGYAGVPWIVGDTDRDLAPAVAAAQIARAFAEHGLVAAPGYLWTDFWLADQTDEVAWGAAVSRDLGLDTLLVSAGGFDARMRSGRIRRGASGPTTASPPMSSTSSCGTCTPRDGRPWTKA